MSSHSQISGQSNPATPPSTPPPRSTPSIPPSIHVPRITSNDIISGSRPTSRPRARRNALFSPTPISIHTRLQMNNVEVLPFRRVEVVLHAPLIQPVLSISSVFGPENPEYWRVNWRSFLNNPFAFSDAIKSSPVEYQDDINKVLDATRCY